MITFNEAKQLLNYGVFPCINIGNSIEYIIGYDENDLMCFTISGNYLYANSANGELLVNSEGGSIE